MVVLLREPRTLAVGDACSSFTFLGGPESLSVAAYRENLLRLRSRLEAGSTPCWTPTAPAVCRRISSTR